ncbi:MAG: peptide-methionine (S)-S-oxide reductase MsrA [Armatimonadetes bacterium]|nr:peptide-methionine (S)-S-oxide reductase MsrA [Armatimonadota bacterium]
MLTGSPTIKAAASDEKPSAELKLAPTKFKAAEGANLERAIFAGGCFWGTEFHFRTVKGVTATAVGYTGGHKENPTYKEVCYTNTGHAEGVMLEFDPKVVSYRELVDQFWEIHNPTTKNRQGPDIGSQYRSAIYTLNDEQMKVALQSKKEAAKMFSAPIVTEIVKASPFYMAEDYHQQYAEKTGKASCPIDRSNHIGG